MSGGLIASVVAPHIPRMGIEENAPDFTRPMIDGLREMGAVLRAMEADLWVLQSAHWVCTFNWYATAHEVHEGLAVADEAPDLVPGLPYRRAGDSAFAKALATRMSDQGIPAFTTSCDNLAWDYATYVPLKYLDEEQTVPVVRLPVVLCSSQEENRAVGRAVHEAAKEAGKRVVYVASTALSHAVIRGPEQWPTPERQALDRTFIDRALAGDLDAIFGDFDDYAAGTVAEMGGRVLSGMLGAAQAIATEVGGVSGVSYGAYAQSSASGNISLALYPANH